MTSDNKHLLKEKGMKKVLLSLLVVLLAGALVISCENKVVVDGNETATVSFATAMGRSLSSSIEYMDFDSLDWYYQAIPAEGAQFTHGATSEWTKLDNKLRTSIELSQGVWTFYLQSRIENSTEVVYEGNKSGVLIKKQSTPVPVTINVSPVEGGNGSIVFSGITIKGKITSEYHPANKALIDGTTELALGNGDVTQQIGSGEHTVVVSYEVGGIVYGSEEIKVTVYSGATVTISGFISEQSQSATFEPNLDAPVTTFSKQLPVSSSSISEDKTTATVSSETTIENEDFKVTYPVDTPITNANADTSTNTADATTGFVYMGDTASDIAAEAGITISASESVAQYQLTLNVDTTNDSVLVKVEKQIEKNLVITRVLHNGTPLATSEGTGEYYTYDSETGILTLFVYHASPIDIITAKTAHLPENAVIVTDVTTLKSALESGTDYIALGNDIDLTGSGGSEGVTALLDTTLDLNGFTLKGNVWSGSYLSSADGTRLTLVDSSFNSLTNEGGQIYSKFGFGTGGAMLQANAVTSWQHAVTINSGRYISNNVAVVCQVQNINASEGVIINGGYFGGTEDLIEGVTLPGPVGGCVEAVIGTITINGGTFKAAQYGSVIIAESGSSNVDTIVNIHGGTFEGACMFDFGKDHSSKSIVNVYGGTFNVKTPNSSSIEDTNFAYDNFTEAALVNNDMFELNIMGGTFNYDPSAYVDTNTYTVTNNGNTWTVSAK